MISRLWTSGKIGRINDLEMVDCLPASRSWSQAMQACTSQMDSTSTKRPHAEHLILTQVLTRRRHVHAHLVQSCLAMTNLALMKQMPGAAACHSQNLHEKYKANPSSQRLPLTVRVSDDQLLWVTEGRDGSSGD